MITVEIPCSHCKQQAAAAVRQRITAGGLAWSMSVSCPFCGDRSELDGEGLPPSDIRQRLLHESGWWEIRVSDSKAILRALQVLRTSLALPDASLLRLRGIAPQGAIRGTKTEMEFVLAQLSAAGVAATIEPSASDSSSAVDLAMLFEDLRR